MLHHRQLNFVPALKYLKRSLREHREEAFCACVAAQHDWAVLRVDRCGEKAITFTDALRAEAGFVEAWVNSAQAALQLSDLKRTLEFAQSALDLNPHAVQAWHMLLLVHYGSGNMRASIAACDRCLGLTPSRPSLLREAEAWAGSKMNSKLINHVRNHYDETCLWQRAMASMAMGQLQEAIAQFDTLLQLEKERGTAHWDDDDFDDDDSGSHHLVFYQREWAVYQLRNLDRDVRTFNPDREINSHFKELFTMRESPRVLIDELGYTTQVVPQMQKPRDVQFYASLDNFNHLCSVVFLKPSRLTSQHLSSSRARISF